MIREEVGRPKATNLIDFVGLPDDLHVRQVEWGDYKELDLSSFLTPDELVRRAAMKHTGRRNGFALGRIALRSLLSELISRSPTEVTLESAPSGQLFFKDADFHVSLAHSGETAIAVAARQPVGIDLEEVREKPDSLLDYILAHDEKEHIRSLAVPDSHRLFLCWTLKESVLKGMGVGLRSSPKKVCLDVQTETQSASILDPSNNVWQGRYCISGSWVSALAFRPE